MLKNIQIYFVVLLLALPMLMGSIEFVTDNRNWKFDPSDHLSTYSLEVVGLSIASENPSPEITLCKEEALNISTRIQMSDTGMGLSKPTENDFNGQGPMQEKATFIRIEVVPELMKFNKEVFTVTAGKKVMLEIDNLDGMQHNLLIVKPGMLEKVGAAADAMLRDPKASEKHYVPKIPEVLFATKMLGPNEVFTLNFTAPTQVGDYPFVCTFPGHWRMMNGIMRVVKP